MFHVERIMVIGFRSEDLEIFLKETKVLVHQNVKEVLFRFEKRLFQLSEC